MPRFLVTTIDNPFDPFEEFEKWYAFDTDKGYNTCAYLARIAKNSEEISDEDQENTINDAVREIIRLNITGLYRKVQEKEDSSAIREENREKSQ